MKTIFSAVFLLFAAAFSWSEGDPQQVSQLKKNIQHIVVIYQENWSFDALYGHFPGADGIANASKESLTQRAKDGSLLTVAPLPLNGKSVDPTFSKLDPALFLKPYDLGSFIKPEVKTGDLIHRFYTEQLQIDGGAMDKFVSWSDNGGLTMSYFDASNMPEGQLAKKYVIFDRFFHSAFGGSFLNHFWLIAARTPTFPNAPKSMVGSFPDKDGLTVADNAVTPDGYAVNTSFSVNQPVPAFVMDRATLVPNQTFPTIGDRLTAKNVSWAWYSGGWNDAMAGKADPLFQYHHQPFVYFENYKDGTDAKKAHMKDESDFFQALQKGDVPAVSFIKPLGPDNEHPGYAALQRGQQHVVELVQKILASSIGKDTIVIITYDENGGRWDHVAPPKVDKWGPGTRVPTILVSDFAKKGYVDHNTYETVSILKLIEERWDLQPLSDRDANAGDLLTALDFAKK